MPIYKTSEQLTGVLQALFDRVGQDPVTVKTLSGSKLIIRIQTSEPEAAVVINGRKSPPGVTYGPTTLKPDLDIQASADSLHKILLGELRLSQAISSNQLKVRGPVWKSFVLQDIFHSAQALYPTVLADLGSQNE